MSAPARYFLIACAVLYRECCLCAAASRAVVDIKIMDKGLHDIGDVRMRARLQAELDAVDYDKYDAVLFAYGLCSNGVKGLHAPKPIVIPRAHDCITLFMGAKEKYAGYFHQNPGAYYKTAGWIERESVAYPGEQNVMSRAGITSYQEYVEKYGKDNADYIIQTMGGGLTNYNKMVYINTHVGHSGDYGNAAEKEALEKGWKYEELRGDLSLLLRLMDGLWDEKDFLVVPPGMTIVPSNDDSIVRAVPLKGKEHL